MRTSPSVLKIILLLILLISNPDKNYYQYINKEVDDEIILEIPPIKITRYEYEKNLNEFKESYKKKFKINASEENIKNWNKEFIDKAYLLAELYSQQFDKRQDVEDAVNSMARIILTQEHGLVYNEFVTKKINSSPDYTNNGNEKDNNTKRKLFEATERKALEDKFNNKIEANISINIHNLLCEKFMNMYDAKLFDNINGAKLKEKLLEPFKDILNDTLMSYSINSKKLLMTLNDFLDFYCRSVIIEIFKNKNDLIKYLTDYVKAEYKLTLADSLGLSKSKKFQLDKQYYKNKTILGFYRYRQVMGKLDISQDEIKNEYSLHSIKYSGSKTVTVSIFLFNNEENARKGFVKLIAKTKKDSIGFINDMYAIGAKRININESIERGTVEYPEELVDKIFMMKNGQVMEPQKLGEEYLVIRKHYESGTIQKPIEKVREEIIKNLKEEKCDLIIKEKISETKNKHQIIVYKIN